MLAIPIQLAIAWFIRNRFGLHYIENKIKRMQTIIIIIIIFRVLCKCFILLLFWLALPKSVNESENRSVFVIVRTIDMVSHSVSFNYVQYEAYICWIMHTAYAMHAMKDSKTISNIMQFKCLANSKQ